MAHAVKLASAFLRAAFVSSVFVLCLPLHAQRSLYAQSIQTALARTTPNLEVLVLDLRTHETLANTFHSTTPIPVGSLLKPFLAIAYFKAHPGPSPAVVCHGHPDRCWKDGGHGAITVTDAIAQSCNAFFLSLARNISPADIPFLPPPPANASPESLIGLTPEWRISPEALVAAYASLLAEPASPTLTAIRNGMRDSARRGTANRIGMHPGGVLTKTGTVPCVDLRCKAAGDGLVIAAVPATHPTLLLLVRKRGTTGAMTAAAAGLILSQLESLHAE